MAQAPGKWRWLVFAVAAFLLLYGVTRLTNLTKLPIFTDEAIYIRWAQIGTRDANWRFISLTDGKQPMYTWLAMIALRLFRDPLFAGRAVSVAAGAFSLLGMWVLAHELFHSRRAGWIASSLYLLSPFALLYDRLALYDSLAATFYIWNFYLGILLVKRIRLDVALILGMTLGAGMLNKSSGFLSLYLLPATLLLFDFRAPKRWVRLVRWIALTVLAAALSQVFYSVLRLTPFFHMIGQKDSVFVYPFSEWLTHPFRFLFGNLNGLFDWLIGYLTQPMFVLCLIPVIAMAKYTREKILLYVWWFAPFFALALFGKVLYARYVLFMAMPLLILAADGISLFFSAVKNKLLVGASLLVFLGPSLFLSYQIIADPVHASIPQSDKSQLIEDWPSGWGVREIVAYLREKAGKGTIAVFTEGTFGMFPAAIEIYLVDHPNVTIAGIWPLPSQMPAQIVQSASVQPTFFILNQAQEPPASWPLDLVTEFQKGGRKDRKMRLYRVLTPYAVPSTVSEQKPI